MISRVHLPSIIELALDNWQKTAVHASALAFVWESLVPILEKLFSGDLTLLVLMCLLVSLDTITLIVRYGFKLLSSENRILKQHINDVAGMSVVILVTIWISNAFEILAWAELWTYMVFSIVIFKQIAYNVGKLRFFEKLFKEIQSRTGWGGDSDGI